MTLQKLIILEINIYKLAMSSQFSWLTIIILFPLLGLIAAPLIPDKEGQSVRLYPLGIALADLFLAATAFGTGFDMDNTQFQLVES